MNPGWRMAASTVIAAVVLAAAGGCAASTGRHVSLNALASRASAVLQADPDVFVLEAEDGVASVLCDTEPFGTDPADPRSISQVRVVYVWAYCAEKLIVGARGGDMIFPAVVHVDGSGRVEIPGDDAAFAGRRQTSVSAPTLVANRSGTRSGHTCASGLRERRLARTGRVTGST